MQMTHMQITHMLETHMLETHMLETHMLDSYHCELNNSVPTFTRARHDVSTQRSQTIVNVHIAHMFCNMMILLKTFSIFRN